VPSVWIRTRPTRESKRFGVEYRLGGRESKIRYGGSFKTKQLAKIRRDYIAGELVNQRIPELGMREPVAQPVFAAAARRGRRPAWTSPTRPGHSTGFNWTSCCR
jgi:hypothetical protein